MWTGSYQVPAPTLTGSVRFGAVHHRRRRDRRLRPPRGSQPSARELARLAADARVAGMLSHKAGLVSVHIDPPHHQEDRHPHHPVPAHAHAPLRGARPRGHRLGVKAGGYIDSAATGVIDLGETAGVNMDNVTVPPDAYGSMPSFDAAGKLVRYGPGSPAALLMFLRMIYFVAHWDAVDEIQPGPHPRELHTKGQIRTGGDADLLLIGHLTLKLKYVIARGRVLKASDETISGLGEMPAGSSSAVLAACC